MTTNEQLARQAAIKVLDVFDLDEIEQVIRATYAEAMAERERYRSALISNLGHTGHCKHPSTRNEVFFDALLANIAKRAKDALQPLEATT